MKSRFPIPTFDLASLAIAFLLSFFLRLSPFSTEHFGILNYSTEPYMISFIIGSVMLVGIFSAFKLYQTREIELSARIFTVLKAIAIWSFITTALIYIIKYDFSRGIFFMTIGFTAIFICLSRYLYFKYLQDKTRSKGPEVEVIIVGTGDRAKSIERQIKESLPNASCKKLDCYDRRLKAHEYLASHSPSDIFIADERLSRDNVMALLIDEDFSHHSFRVVLDTFRLATGEVHLNDIDEIPSIAPRDEPKTAYKLIKRSLDIIFAGVSIIVISPIWLTIATVIKLDSDGPALIRQTRVGWNGEPFTILKFRTMRTDVSLYDMAPRHEADGRITKIGKLLRRFSLDELPQLWNILRDEMSLVGPRPEMEFLVKNYEPWQRFRLKAKPGLTGLWQILGRKDIPLNENLEYDFYYITNRGLLLDLAIILKTIPAVLFGRGAY